jgi:hypothetical protein
MQRFDEPDRQIFQGKINRLVKRLVKKWFVLFETEPKVREAARAGLRKFLMEDLPVAAQGLRPDEFSSALSLAIVLSEVKYILPVDVFLVIFAPAPPPLTPERHTEVLEMAARLAKRNVHYSDIFTLLQEDILLVDQLSLNQKAFQANLLALEMFISRLLEAGYPGPFKGFLRAVVQAGATSEQLPVNLETFGEAVLQLWPGGVPPIDLSSIAKLDNGFRRLNILAAVQQSDAALRIQYNDIYWNKAVRIIEQSPLSELSQRLAILGRFPAIPDQVNHWDESLRLVNIFVTTPVEELSDRLSALRDFLDIVEQSDDRENRLYRLDRKFFKSEAWVVAAKGPLQEVVPRLNALKEVLMLPEEVYSPGVTIARSFSLEEVQPRIQALREFSEFSGGSRVEIIARDTPLPYVIPKLRALKEFISGAPFTKQKDVLWVIEKIVRESPIEEVSPRLEAIGRFFRGLAKKGGDLGTLQLAERTPFEALFNEAWRLRKSGYDFEVEVTPEKGHYEEQLITGADFGDPGGLNLYGPDTIMGQMVVYVVDQPQQIKLVPLPPSSAQQSGLEERVPAWLDSTLGADWVEVVYGVHEMAQVADRVAVLLQPELVGVDGDDGDTEVALMSLEGNLHSAFGWSDEMTLRLGLFTPQSVEAFEEKGYRVIRVLRHPESEQTPLPWEAVPIVVAEALADGRSTFWVNVTPYLTLRGITLPEILATLTDLFA